MDGATEKSRRSAVIESLCDACPNIDARHSTFCFTGKSSRMCRDGIAQKVAALGGNVRRDVSRNVDYLVVGNEGSPHWAYMCYGCKVLDAMRLQKAGSGIRIVREDDFWRAIG